MRAPTTPQWVTVCVLSAITAPVTGTCRMKGVMAVIFMTNSGRSGFGDTYDGIGALMQVG